jgi:hypothetical protein
MKSNKQRSEDRRGWWLGGGEGEMANDIVEIVVRGTDQASHIFS